MINDAYVAGVFDGEGSVGVYAVHTNGKRQNADGWWNVRLAIVGTHRPMIEAIYNYMGVGSFTTQKRQSLQKTPRGDYGEGALLCKQGWKWNVTSRDECKLVLMKILPFLIEKKEQVEIVLNFIKGELEGREANELCTKAKKFNFSKNDFVNPTRRNGASKGSSHVLAKLTDEQVLEARTKYKEKGTSVKELAVEYGISIDGMRRVLKNQSYKNLKGD